MLSPLPQNAFRGATYSARPVGGQPASKNLKPNISPHRCMNWAIIAKVYPSFQIRIPERLTINSRTVPDSKASETEKLGRSNCASEQLADVTFDKKRLILWNRDCELFGKYPLY